MPLLLREPEAALPAERDVEVPGGEAALIEVGRGQLLTVEAHLGGQVAELFAWTTEDRAEWLSPHHTRVFGGTFELRMGTRLVTNRRRPILVAGRDSLRKHDLLLPASVEAVAAVRRALDSATLAVPRVPDPVRLFAWTDLDPDGRIGIHPSPARPGERWTARVLIDATVCVAAAVTGIRSMSADPPRALRVTVRNDVRDLGPELPVWTGLTDPNGSRRPGLPST
jgi:uncharacterized protein